ncbi:MAG: hypothetical protein EXS37_03110 [Opitutus sp.]|nr:hypothetical protein [Opitutus sp.]
MKKNLFRWPTALCLVLLGSPLRAEPDPPGSTVLFAFDDTALPFRQGLKLNLVKFESTADGSGNLALAPGSESAPDGKGIIYYGSVAEVNGELWMWYLGLGNRDQKRQYRVCLAKSKDGHHWERPALGALEYGGSKENNLVGLDLGQASAGSCVVYYEPDAVDAGRRFKMIFTGKYEGLRFGVAYSPDGVHWTESPDNPRGALKLEPQGGIKWNGAYYVNGQGGMHWSPDGWVRTLVTHMSYDFENWTEATMEGFRRDPLPPRPNPRTGGIDGEQIHLGAAMWNRGNVIVGFYGQWHGHPNNDRRYVSIDMGFVISHDALHFSEPIPDFRMVTARETPSWWLPNGRTMPLERAPALMQGQGFANIGKETLFWYSVWVIPTAGVRVARWERDRLGYLQPFVSDRKKPHVISAPIETVGGPIMLSANVSGLSENSHLVATVLDERFHALPGFTTTDSTPLTTSGLRQRLTWGGNSRVPASGRIRVRLDFTGLRAEDIKLFALYAEPAK